MPETCQQHHLYNNFSHAIRDKRTGGRVFRSNPQLIFANHLCCFTSLAPLLLPNLVRSLLSSSRFTQSFPALETNKHISQSHFLV